MLPESQYDFRKGRGCMDMVFTMRQLVEQFFEHKEKLFVTFVDLKKPTTLFLEGAIGQSCRS